MTEAQREALAGFLGTEVRQQPGPPNAPQVPLNGNPFPSIDLGDRDWWRGILTGIVIDRKLHARATWILKNF